MKKKTVRVTEKSQDMVLHRTLHDAKAAQVSSATQGLAHKLRNLSVPITDIRKDNSLHSLGLEDQGHGVWRFNTNQKPTPYHRHIRLKANRGGELSADGNNGNPIGSRGSVDRPKNVTDGLGENYVLQTEGKMNTRRNVPKVIDISSNDEENLSACEPPARVRDRKMRLSARKSDDNEDKKVICKTKNKSSDIQVDAEKQSPPELKSRSSRNQSRIGSPIASDSNLKGKKAPAECPTIRRASNVSLPLGSSDVKKSPRILVKRLASPWKRGIPSTKSPGKGNASKVLVGKDKGLKTQPKSVVALSELGTKKYVLRSVAPTEVLASRKRKGEISAASISDDAPKPVKTQRLLDIKSERNRKKSNATSPSNSSKQEKAVGYLKKKATPKKPKRNSGAKKGTENDVDFKVSPSTNADGKALPKLKLTRKHQSKFPMQWCEICGVELDSLDNKLEHEFSHQEPRQLFVSIHRCELSQTFIKVPMYVSEEDLAAIPNPREDTSSPVVSNDLHPLLSTENILNNDEENAYDSWSSSDDENRNNETEEALADNNAQDPPMGNVDGVAMNDVVSPAATPEMSMPIKSPKSLGTKERSKRKSQVKMRLWEGSPVTRSGRVVKVTQKTKECLEQSSCVRALFSQNMEAERSGAICTPLAEAECLTKEKLMEEESASEERLIPPVDEYVEVVVMKERLKDIVESSEFPNGDVDLSSGKEINAQCPSLETNVALETEDSLSADGSTVEQKRMTVETEEKNDKQNEEDEGNTLPMDTADDGFPPIQEVKTPKPTSEANEALKNKVHSPSSSNTIKGKGIPLETNEVNNEQNEKDEGCISLGDIAEDSLSPVEKVETTEPSLEAGDAPENEVHLSAGSSTTKDKGMSLETNEVNDEQNEKDEGCISLGDIAEDSLSPVEKVETTESSLEAGDAPENEVHLSAGSGTTKDKGMALETNEVNDEQNEKEDEGCISSGDIAEDSLSPVEKVETTESSLEAGDAPENEVYLSAGSSTTKDKVMALETNEVNDEKNEKDDGCISSGDIAEDSLSPVEKVETTESSLEAGDASENEVYLSSGSSNTKDKVMALETNEVNDEQNERDECCISSGDIAEDSLSPVEKVEMTESSLEAGDAPENEVNLSSGSSNTKDKGIPLKTNEVNDEQNEKDQDCILSGDIVNEAELSNPRKKDDISESGFNTTSDMNQNLMLEVEAVETQEKQSDSLESEMMAEIPGEEISLRLEDSLLSLEDPREEQVENDTVQESKVSGPDNLEAAPERDSGDLMPENKMGIGELLEDDNSKDIMLVDESNDVLVGGTLAENVEMQGTLETEFVGVSSDIDISKFNMPEDQGLEDISDTEWTDISSKEMQDSSQYANDHLGDVEMDEEGSTSAIDNVGPEGEMNMEETEKGNGLSDPMCTGDIISETLEEEMKDLENTEDDIMAEHAVDDTDGPLSPKENINIAGGGESMAEVDMAETAEDPETGCVVEAIDAIQEQEEAAEDRGGAVVGVGEKANEDDGQVSAEGGSEVIAVEDQFWGAKVIKVNAEKESPAASRGENSVLSIATVVKTVAEGPAQTSQESKMPVNSIGLVAVVEGGEEQGSDVHCGEREEVTSGNMFAGGDNGENVDALRECAFKLKNDLYSVSQNTDPNKMTLGHGSKP